MELSTFRSVDFGPFSDFEIEDVGFFHTMVSRIIEDTELVSFSVAKINERENIDKDTVASALVLIDDSLRSEVDSELEAEGHAGGGGYGLAVAEQVVVEADTAVTFASAPSSLVLRSLEIQDFARSPLPHDPEALQLLSKFVNFHILNMIRAAALKCQDEGLKVIKLRHYLPWCEEWPYPLNRYC